jgi:drug/metabolite transporter (DMT)-like permease
LRAPKAVFAALCFVWGSTWLAIKVGLEYLPPFLFAGMRFGTATISLLLIMRLLHARMPRDRSSWALMLFLGAFQITLPYGLVFWGEQYISSGLSAVLFATLPFFVSIFAHFVAGERLTKLKLVGVVASFVGLVVIFWRDIIAFQSAVNQLSLFGSLAVVGSAMSGGLGNVVAKRNAERIDPASNVFVQMLIGALVLSFIGAGTETSAAMHFTITATMMILYLGVVGSALGFVGLYWLLRKMTATNVSLITFVNPIVALLLGWLVLGEVPDPNIGIGAVLILAGVYFAARSGSK